VALWRCLQKALTDAGGWLPFDRYMALVLYEPGLGYYARSSQQFGHTPTSGSDFVTAPELSPLFGAALARQLVQALDAAQADTVYEFGAGSGALAEQLLNALGERVQHYKIIDVSGALAARQRERLAAFGTRVQWLKTWPDTLHGVVLGNEVLDAMPVQLLTCDGTQWFERGVELRATNGVEHLAWADRATALRPPLDGFWPAGSVLEIHPQAEAFVRSLAARLQRGVAFFIDYGFPEVEYYHPQRHQGTLMCHRLHQADTHPLADPGEKDITAHVNFSGVALAAQDAGLQVLGYTSQAHFLMNCGLLDLLQGADVRTVANAQKLLTEHEMGELFKVIALGQGVAFEPLGFVAGDRCHTL
jgi:SAM-dependent MidA family methyltransferase